MQGFFRPSPESLGLKAEFHIRSKKRQYTAHWRVNESEGFDVLVLALGTLLLEEMVIISELNGS